MARSFDDFLNVLQEAAVAYSRLQHKEAIPTCSNYDNNTIHNDDSGAQSSSSPLPCHSSISPPPLLHTHHHHHHHYSSSLPFDHNDDLISDNTQFDDHELFLPLINSPMANFSNNTNDSPTLQQYQDWWNDFFPTPSSPSSYTFPLSPHQQSTSNITTLNHESTLPSTNSYSTSYENEDNSISISHEESFTTLTHEPTLPSTNFYSTYHANEDNSISYEDSFSSPQTPKDNNLNMNSKKIKLTTSSSESRDDTKVMAKQKQRRAKKDVAKWMIMTKSQVDVMDDGFRWRKYGQKCVKKNAVYPRSYFKCTHRGCGAQKRVERCAVDDENVLTTYHGIHTHFASS